jgi:hypothetical protein
MSSFWANACNYAYNIQPVQTKLNNAYISCGVTVRCMQRRSSLHRAQVYVFL